MKYLCSQLSEPNAWTGMQDCEEWTATIDFSDFAITQEQAHEIGLAVALVLVVVFAYRQLKRVL